MSEDDVTTPLIVYPSNNHVIYPFVVGDDAPPNVNDDTALYAVP